MCKGDHSIWTPMPSGCQLVPAWKISCVAVDGVGGRVSCWFQACRIAES